MFLLTGKNATLPAYVQKKVLPTNLILCFLIGGLAIPFTAISLFYFGWLTIWPALGIVFCIVSWLFNRFMTKGIYVSRMMACILPMVLGALFNAYLSDSNGQPLPALYLCEGSFLSIPFVVYDLKEIKQLVISTTICIVIIVTFQQQNNLLVSQIPSDVIRTGWLSTVTVVLACGTSIGLILGLAILNKMEQDISEKLTASDRIKTKKLECAAAETELKLKDLAKENLSIAAIN